MGLFSRIGKEWADQIGNGGARVRDYLGGPPMLAGMGGAAIGGPALALDAANPGDDPFDRAAQGAAIGAAGMGGIGLGAAGTMGLKQLVVAIARAMKQKLPNQPDEAIMQQATAVVRDAMGRPDARAQLEKILGKMNWDSPGAGPGGGM